MDQTEFSVPAVKREIEALYAAGAKPSVDTRVDGRLDWPDARSWTPLTAVDWNKNTASVAGLMQLGWNESALFVTVFLPGAAPENTIATGETPPAPFVIEITLDAQREPNRDAPACYRARFVPLTAPVPKSALTTVVYLRNRVLGSGVNLDDPGLVLFGEESHAGFPLDGVQARWGKGSVEQAAPSGGLVFEASVPWRNLGIKNSPVAAPLFFNLSIARAGMPRCDWIAGARGERETGGQARLLPQGQTGDSGTEFLSKTMTPLIQSDLSIQEHPLHVAFPLDGLPNVFGATGISFSLIGPDSKTAATADSVAREKAISKEGGNRVAMAELKTQGLPDGVYRVRAQVAGAQRPGAYAGVSERPIRLAGQCVRDKLRPERSRLEERLAQLRKVKGAPWREGHFARADSCLKIALLPPNARAADLAKCFDRLDDARAILDALENNKRPDAGREGAEHPAGFAADGAMGSVEFIPVAGDKARLTVFANKPAAAGAISPLIYGTFSEPLVLGRHIYTLLHAQRVINSSFEWGSPPSGAVVRSRSQLLDVAAADEIAKGQWLPIRKGDGEVAAPWLGVGEGGARFSIAGGAYNTSQCQAIEADGAARGVGVAQIIDLPVWRCGAYHFRCALRAEGKPASAKAVLYYQKKPVSEAALEPIGQEWRVFEGNLEDKAAPRADSNHNTYLLAIVFDGPGKLFIDQATLMPADAIDGFDPQAIEQIRQMRTGWVRWPGGNYASAYHWRDGVGPLDRRPTRINPAWQGLDPNHVGTDDYLRLCELAGLEPFITVNAGNGTPQEAADWVEYCNGSSGTPMGRLRAANGHPKPYGVRYWNVGNELWGRWQAGCCEASEHAARYEAFARAMRQRDSSIHLIACGIGPFGGENAARWNGALMDRIGKDLEALDFHIYAAAKIKADQKPADALEALAAMPVGFERAMMDFRQTCHQRGLDQLKIVQGEYAVTPIEGVGPRLMLTGNLLAYAGWLHCFLRQGEGLLGANATEFSVFNPRSSAFGLQHPRLPLYGLYARELGSRLVAARLETPVSQRPQRAGRDIPPIFNLPLVDAVALTDPKDGSLSISLLNRDLKREIACEIALDGFTPQAQAARYVYADDLDIAAPGKDHPRPQIRKSDMNAANAFSLALPPCSVTLLKLPSAAPPTLQNP